MSWTDEELTELKEYFGKNIRENRNVREKECIDVIQKSRRLGKILHRRPWETIKKKVNYLIIKSKKKAEIPHK